MKKLYDLLLKELLDGGRPKYGADSEGNLWLVSSGGALLFRDTRQVFNTALMSPADQKPLVDLFFGRAEAWRNTLTPVDDTRAAGAVKLAALRLEQTEALVWVNKKYLDLFPPKTYHFAGLGSRSPVYCINQESWEVEGVIFPYAVRD